LKKDFTYSGYDFKVHPPYRQLGELLFVRKFEHHEHMIKEVDGGWWSAMASHLLSTTVSAVSEIGSDIASTCDVEWFSNFEVTRHEHTEHIASCKVVLAPHYEEELRRFEKTDFDDL
jgi:hypothetical protein